MTIPFIEQNGVLTLWVKGQMLPVGPDHRSYLEIKEALRTGTEDEIWKLFNPAEVVAKKFEEMPAVNGELVRFDTKTRTVSYMGQPIHSSLVEKALEFLDKDLPYEPLLAFLQRLMENPSASSVRELYVFLENKHLPITEDGCFLAYKAVKEDWTDKYTGTISNKLGTEVSVPRNQVDDAREHECSFGLHVGAHDYVYGYGSGTDKFLIVKVDPKDCVSVPRDHSAQKLRVCKYTVLKEVAAQTILDESPLYRAQSAETHMDEYGMDYLGEYDDYEEEEPEPFDLVPVPSKTKTQVRKDFETLEDTWEEWTRDEVVLEAWKNGLIRTKEEGRQMGKLKVCSILEDHGITP